MRDAHPDHKLLLSKVPSTSLTISTSLTPALFLLHRSHDDPPAPSLPSEGAQSDTLVPALTQTALLPPSHARLDSQKRNRLALVDEVCERGLSGWEGGEGRDAGALSCVRTCTQFAI